MTRLRTLPFKINEKRKKEKRIPLYNIVPPGLLQDPMGAHIFSLLLFFIYVNTKQKKTIQRRRKK